MAEKTRAEWPKGYRPLSMGEIIPPNSLEWSDSKARWVPCHRTGGTVAEECSVLITNEPPFYTFELRVTEIIGNPEPIGVQMDQLARDAYEAGRKQGWMSGWKEHGEYIEAMKKAQATDEVGAAERRGYERGKAEALAAIKCDGEEEQPHQDGLPTLGSLRGIAPNATGGLRSEDFVRNLRGEEGQLG